MAKKKSAAAAAAAAAAESPAATNSPTPAGSASTSRGVAFSSRETGKRSSLRYHERNPRIIDPHAFKKLKKFVKKNGLIGGIGVNRRLAANGFDPSENGRLVIIGGHRRAMAMDELVGFDAATGANDYQVPIEVIEVGPAQEIEILIGLNNPGMQGAWDNELLSEILTFPDVDPLATGFDRMELTHMLDSGVLEQIFGDGDSSASSSASGSASAESPMLDDFEQIANEARGGGAPGAPGSADSSSAPPASPGPGAQSTAPAGAPAHFNSHPSITPEDGDPLDPNSVAAMKNRRVDYRGGLRESQQATLSNYITLTGTNSAEIDRLLRALSLPLDERFFDLSMFLERLGLDELADSLRDAPFGEDGGDIAVTQEFADTPLDDTESLV